MTRRPSRYSAVAITLHWLIAVAILSMIPMGWWMSDAIVESGSQAMAYRVFQIHKSIGFLVLALTVLRIMWRLTHPVPALPGAMKGWEQFAARATHAAFYALMLAMPLTGWAYVSTGWAVVTDTPLAVATSWFGLFSIPHLPFIEHASESARRAMAWMAMGAHSKLAWGAIVLVTLHVGAALKHQFLDRDGVLSQMVPALPHGDDSHGLAPEPALAMRWAERLAGVAFVIIIAVAFGLAARPLSRAEGQVVASTPAVAAVADASVEPGTAPAWTVDKAASSIAFTGTHTGKAFTGRFEQWDAQIWFDPGDLAGSKAVVTINTVSAKTGDATQESSMPGTEWFDAATYPTARFEATAFKSLGANRYEATGILRIKTTTIPVVLPFTFDEANGNATVAGKLELDRTALNMGLMSDAGGDWVSKSIGVEIKVKAARRG